MNPVEEFLSEFGEVKEAGFGQELTSSFGNAMMGAGTLAAGAAIVGGATYAGRAIHSAATKNRDFRGMMDMNPDLHQFHEQDPKMFNQMYTSLRRANQAYASDPVISGTYMRKMMDSPMHAGGILTDAMSGVPASQGQFAKDIGRSAMEGFSGRMKDQAGPFGRKGPSAKDELESLKAQRGLAFMKNNPNAFGPPGGKKNRP